MHIHAEGMQKPATFQTLLTLCQGPHHICNVLCLGAVSRIWVLHEPSKVLVDQVKQLVCGCLYSVAKEVYLHTAGFC